MGKSNKMDDGIGWAISRLVPSGRQKRTGIIKRSVSDKWGHNDFKVCWCPKCKQVWDWHRMSNWVNVMYHADFPTYGLKHDICFICEPNGYQGSSNQIRIKYL